MNMEIPVEHNLFTVLIDLFQNLARFHHLPTPQELEGMKEDLAFKETEMKKSEATSSGLAGGENYSMVLANKCILQLFLM